MKRHRKVTLRQKPSGMWFAQWRDPVTSRHRGCSLRTKDAAEAERLAAVIERNLNKGSDPDGVRTAVRAAASRDLQSTVDEYLAHRRALRPGTRHARANLPWSLGRLVAFLGRTFRVTDLGRAQLAAFADALLQSDLAPGTKRAVLTHARQFGKWLVDQGFVPDNPADRLAIPSMPRPKEIAFYDEADVQAVVAAAREFSPDALGFVLMPLMTGLRATEVLRLLWQDVDFTPTGPHLNVANHGKNAATGIAGHQTKTASSVRQVPLEEPLLSWLREHREFGHGPYVFMHPPARGGTRSHLLGGLARVKDPQKLAELQQRLDAALAEEAGRWRSTPRASWSAYGQWPRKLAVWIQKQTGVRWDCRVARHTFATMLLKRGQIFDVETGRPRALTQFDLQRLMGHASVTTTERCYLGHYPMRVKLDLAHTLGLTSPVSPVPPTAAR